MMKVGTERTAEAGFTIIELLIATLVFSMILLVLAVGILTVTREFLHGSIESQTQGVARTIENTIAQSIQFNGSTVMIPSSGQTALCVGDIEYDFNLGKEVEDQPDPTAGQAYHGLVATNVGSGCNPQTPKGVTPTTMDQQASLPAGAHELLSANMRLDKFEVATTPSGSYKICVRVIYGSSDLLKGGSQSDYCSSGGITPAVHICNASLFNLLGGQFCYSSELDTTVDQRVCPAADVTCKGA